MQALTNNEQREMYNAVIRIETKCVGCEKTIAEHSQKIETLDRFMWVSGGIISFISFLGLGNLFKIFR